MTYRKKTNNKKFLDEESQPENDYLTSVLSVVNGYCKINLEVPQTSSFYTSDILLPINAKVNSSTLDSKIQKCLKSIQPESLTDVLKNVESLKIDKNMDDTQSYPSSKTHEDEFQVYSKPSYSDININNHTEKKEDNKRSISPKGKKKKNKLSRTDSSSASTSDNQTIEHSECTDQNSSVDYFSQYENDRSEDGLHIQQEQELQKKQMKNLKNNMNNTHTLRNSESVIQNDRLPSQSQCPLCFRLYPTPDIEAHASECSI